MLLEWLTNPWVIIIIVVSIIIGNIAALKYTANIKVGTMSTEKKQDLERLKKLDEERRGKINQHMKDKSPDESEGGGSSGNE